LFSFFVGL